MSTTTLGLALTIVATLVSALVWYLKRQQSPTPQQRADDRDAEIARIYEEIDRLEVARDYAAADALRRRLQVSLGVQSGGAANSPGQRLPGATAGGDNADAAR